MTGCRLALLIPRAQVTVPEGYSRNNAKTHPGLAVNLIGHKIRLQGSYVFVACLARYTQRSTVELRMTQGKVHSTRLGACKVLVHEINVMITLR
jgi:hypothetical protein